VHSSLYCGVSASVDPAVTQLDGDQPAASERIDDKSYLDLLTKLNANPILLPPGAAERIERLSRVLSLDLQHSEAARIGKFLEASPLLAKFMASFPKSTVGNTPAVPQEGPAPFLSVIMRTQGAEARI